MKENFNKTEFYICAFRDVLNILLKSNKIFSKNSPSVI